MSETLKPCPFCGGEAFVHMLGNEIAKGYYIACDECGAKTIVFGYEAEAIEEWNRRVATDMNVGDKETVIIEPFTTDMNHVGYCKCGYLVNAEWKYCPNCGAKLDWSDDE